MKSPFAAIVLAIATSVALPAPAGERDVVYGPESAVRLLAPYVDEIQAKSDIAIRTSKRDIGQLVLEVIDGKATAAVIAIPLSQAVAAARGAAWAEGRMLTLPVSLRFHEVAGVSRDGVPAGLVTLGAAPESLDKVLAELHDASGNRKMFAQQR